MTNPVTNWTDSRYWSFIRSALREASRRYPPKFKVVQAAKRKKTHGKNSKQKWEYKCAECNKHFPNKVVIVDHIKPLGKLKDYEDLPEFVSNLFCGAGGLQVLCRPCHYLKTMKERGINPVVAQFKKLDAKGQKTELIKLGLEVGSNAVKRVKIFEESL